MSKSKLDTFPTPCMLCMFQRHRICFTIRHIAQCLPQCSRQTLHITEHCSPLDDIKCNESATHWAALGEKITYSCSFKYQGLLHKDYVVWRGHLGRDAITEMHSLPNVTVPTAQPGTCYKGESIIRKQLHTCLTGHALCGSTMAMSGLTIHPTLHHRHLHPHPPCALRRPSRPIFHEFSSKFLHFNLAHLGKKCWTLSIVSTYFFKCPLF